MGALAGVAMKGDLGGTVLGRACSQCWKPMDLKAGFMETHPCCEPGFIPRLSPANDQQNVLDLDPVWMAGFDAIHASPPCQFYSTLKHRYPNGNNHPDLIGPVRDLLQAIGRPFVIENVQGARRELVDPVMLCGLMFPGLRVFRHRFFELWGFDFAQPEHPSHAGHKAHTLDRRKVHFGRTNEWRDFVSVNGGGNSSKAAAADAMGLPQSWTKHELNEAIPPCYTEHIGIELRSSGLQLSKTSSR